MTSSIRWLHRIFPCRFNETKCINNPLGCRCGKSKSAKKAEQRADDLARQAREAVIKGTTPTAQEQAAIDASYGAAARQLPFLETRSREAGGQLFGEISPEALQYAQLVSRQAAAPTQISYQDLFDPLYQRAKENVAAFANQRGLVGSGLELEQMGRAAVEIALGQAQARQQNALINEQLRQQAVASLGELVSGQAGLGTEARGEYANFLGGQQSLADILRARQAGGVVQAQQAAAPYFGASIEALQNRVAQSKQNVQGIGKLLATAAAIAAAGPTGGASLAAIPAINSMGSGGSGRGSDMGSVASLLNAQQSGNVAPSYGQPGYAGMGYVNNPQWTYQSPQQRSWRRF